MMPTRKSLAICQYWWPNLKLLQVPPPGAWCPSLQPNKYKLKNSDFGGNFFHFRPQTRGGSPIRKVFLETNSVTRGGIPPLRTDSVKRVLGHFLTPVYGVNSSASFLARPWEIRISVNKLFQFERWPFWKLSTSMQAAENWAPDAWNWSL